MNVILQIGSEAEYRAALPIVDDPEVAYWLFADGKPQGFSYFEPPRGDGVGPTLFAKTIESGVVVGGGRIERDGFSYFVSRAEWGKGYGTQIASQMLEQFRSRRIDSAVLHIRRENIVSRRIAERLGFRVTGQSGVGPVMLKFVL